MRAAERLIDGLSGREAARILGVWDEVYVARLVSEGVIPKARKAANNGLERADVERVSLERWRPGRPHPYWATTSEVAEMFGITRSRVGQLTRRGDLPAVQHGGRWFFRRHQVEVIANAREARRLR